MKKNVVFSGLFTTEQGERIVFQVVAGPSNEDKIGSCSFGSPVKFTLQLYQHPRKLVVSGVVDTWIPTNRDRSTKDEILMVRIVPEQKTRNVKVNLSPFKPNTILRIVWSQRKREGIASIFSENEALVKVLEERAKIHFQKPLSASEGIINKFQKEE